MYWGQSLINTEQLKKSEVYKRYWYVIGRKIKIT